MCKIFGYGEDAFTLWALKRRTDDISREFQDPTVPSDFLVFYRPSFGRSGGEGSAECGEFDAILISRENVYLIEGKWDNFSEFKGNEVAIDSVQRMRHNIFSWYITHWDKKYSGDWVSFVKEQTFDFQEMFPERKIAPTDSLLASNLEFVLNALQKHCGKSRFEDHIKDVLLFFYNGEKSEPPTKVAGGFRPVKLDYSREIIGNYVALGWAGG